IALARVMTPNANCTGSKSQKRSTCSNQTSDTSAACWVFSTSSRRPVSYCCNACSTVGARCMASASAMASSMASLVPEPRPFEEPAEDLGHPVGGLLFAEPLESGSLKGLGIGLENPGRTAHFVLIGVGDERPPLGFLENKG